MQASPLLPPPPEATTAPAAAGGLLAWGPLDLDGELQQVHYSPCG